MKKAVEAELLGNIYPFWSAIVSKGDHFPGRIDSDGITHDDAPKSAVMVMRMLWAFSAIAELHTDCGARKDADFMYGYIKKYFIDHDNGGVWWSLNADNSVENPKKQSYAIGFAIYALSQYYLVSKEKEALDLALSLFEDIEKHCWDDEAEGYIEALTEDWRQIEDMRLSDKDENSVFTMNTHLHILEPYTTLYRASHDERVKDAIIRLLDIFCDKMYNPETQHLGLFFDRDWNLESDEISFGHDIEASWLMCEAVNAIQPHECLHYVHVADELVYGCEEEAYPDGCSMIYKKDAQGYDTERHWWVQAEAIVGLVKMYRRSGDESWLEKAHGIWDYVDSQIVDHNGGEWFWGRMEDGSIGSKEDKAGFWKCPYHNSRMCLEIAKEL